MVRRLPCNLEKDRRRGFNWNRRVRTREANASRRLQRRGPFMAARVSKHRVAWEPLQNDDGVRLFNPLPSATSSPSTLLPTIFLEKRHREEGKAKAQGEGEERGALTIFIIVVDLAAMAGDKCFCILFLLCSW